nr:immunoglobulin heavy chain junction region [Macaca mulatta]MOY21650.1 immunoglobulin heavy chain junction region [Macaca mulatta]MOY21673.1 immunoglobulin heavy chain junction region [Macaca mulatta]MOY21770.1 immunoglobulin heavy chain junction region [Macaca mulatta]MOY22014.1 immunoglobulin heavy chain junction region [Macaca mulatta]
CARMAVGAWNDAFGLDSW